MALVGHWPLNGNANDISGNGYTLTNNGATYVSGKIGQAADFVSASSQYMVGPVSQNLYTSNSYFTLAFWVFLKSLPTGSTGLVGFNKYYTETEGGGFGIGFKTTGVLTFIVGDKINTTEIDYVAANFPLNTWLHLSMKFDGSKVYHYLNGQLLGFANRTLWRANNVALEFAHGTQGGWGSYSNIRLNDVRLFNHALTDMEIQEIAKAKVVHYSFDDMQEPTTNLVTPEFSQWEVDSSGYANTGTRTILSSYYCRIVDVDANTRQSRVFSGVSENSIYTASVKFKKVSGAPTLRFQIQPLNSGGTNLGSIWTTTSQMGIQDTDGWQTAIYTFTTPATTVSIRWYIQDGNDYTGYTHIFELKEIQFEKKEYASEFVHGSRTGRVNDSSKLMNHSQNLTETNTPKWTSESKIGIGAYIFRSSDSKTYFTGPNNLMQFFKDFTISVWIKLNSAPTETNLGYVIAQQYGGGGWILSIRGNDSKVQFRHHRDTANGFITAYNLLSTNSLQTNTWYHITAKDDGNIARIYVNGIENNSFTISSIIPGPSNQVLRVGAFNTSGNAHFDGTLDDIRIYATALSDNDIKDLYETRAQIEQSGTLYAKDFLSNCDETVNLVSNSSFESGNTTNWYINNATTGTWSIDTTTSYHGQNSLKITVSNGGDQYQYIGHNYGFDVSGKTYTISAYIKTRGTTTNIRILTYWKNSSGSWIWSNNVSSSIASGTNNWTRLTATAVAPAGTFQVVILIAPFTRDGNGMYWIDAVQIEEKGYASSFTPSSRSAIQLPSTVKFLANEIHENGIANFDNFSTSGVTSGLVSYWSLDRDAKDLSGNNFHGTVTGAVPYGEFYKFNGSGDNIDIPFEVLSTQQIRDNGITMIAKVRPTTIQNSRIFSMKQSTGYSDAATGGIGMNSSGNPMAICYDDNISYKYVTGSTSMTTGVWYHIVALYNNVDATLRLYVNSVQEGTPLVITTYSRLIANAETFIGKDGSNMFYFAGDIDYVKVFNRALTEEEIRIEYNTMFNNEVQIHNSDMETLYAKNLIQY